MSLLAPFINMADYSPTSIDRARIMLHLSRTVSCRRHLVALGVIDRC
jgi:hypothetical protein